ncbi:MAG: hypothetical protein AAFP90_17055, partial [Planctomycetota bacterium]
MRKIWQLLSLMLLGGFCQILTIALMSIAGGYAFLMNSAHIWVGETGPATWLIFVLGAVLSGGPVAMGIFFFTILSWYRHRLRNLPELLDNLAARPLDFGNAPGGLEHVSALVPEMSALFGVTPPQVYLLGDENGI